MPFQIGGNAANQINPIKLIILIRCEVAAANRYACAFELQSDISVRNADQVSDKRVALRADRLNFAFIILDGSDRAGKPPAFCSLQPRFGRRCKRLDFDPALNAIRINYFPNLNEVGRYCGLLYAAALVAATIPATGALLIKRATVGDNCAP